MLNNQIWRIQIFWLKGSSKFRVSACLFDLSEHYLGFLQVQLHLRPHWSAWCKKAQREYCEGRTRRPATNRRGRSAKLQWGYLQSNFSFSKQSGGCFEGLCKTSSGHRAVQSQLHKVGTWWRRDKWDFTNKGKHKPSQLSVRLLSWGTASLACSQQKQGQKTQPKVHTLFELKKRLNVEIYNFTGKVWEEGK